MTKKSTEKLLVEIEYIQHVIHEKELEILSLKDKLDKLQGELNIATNS